MKANIVDQHLDSSNQNRSLWFYSCSCNFKFDQIKEVKSRTIFHLLFCVHVEVNFFLLIYFLEAH